MMRNHLSDSYNKKKNKLSKKDDNVNRKRQDKWSSQLKNIERKKKKNSFWHKNWKKGKKEMLKKGLDRDGKSKIDFLRCRIKRLKKFTKRVSQNIWLQMQISKKNMKVKL